MESKIRSCLLVVFAVVALALIAYNIYTGATIQEIGIPGLFTIKFGDKTAPGPGPNPLAQTYLMDNQPSRVISVSYLGGNGYRLEESSSPWPWEGTANLDGGKLSGDAKFRNTLATMRVEGILRGDGSIEIQYKYITGDDGKPAGGRIDNHVWFPVH
jgi:hypothetical protein